MTSQQIPTADLRAAITAELLYSVDLTNVTGYQVDVAGYQVNVGPGRHATLYVALVDPSEAAQRALHPALFALQDAYAGTVPVTVQLVETVDTLRPLPPIPVVDAATAGAIAAQIQAAGRVTLTSRFLDLGAGPTLIFQLGETGEHISTGLRDVHFAPRSQVAGNVHERAAYDELLETLVDHRVKAWAATTSYIDQGFMYSPSAELFWTFAAAGD